MSHTDGHEDQKCMCFHMQVVACMYQQQNLMLVDSFLRDALRDANESCAYVVQQDWLSGPVSYSSIFLVAVAQF